MVGVTSIGIDRREKLFSNMGVQEEQKGSQPLRMNGIVDEVYYPGVRTIYERGHVGDGNPQHLGNPHSFLSLFHPPSSFCLALGLLSYPPSLPFPSTI